MSDVPGRKYGCVKGVNKYPRTKTDTELDFLPDAAAQRGAEFVAAQTLSRTLLQSRCESRNRLHVPAAPCGSPPTTLSFVLYHVADVEILRKSPPASTCAAVTLPFRIHSPANISAAPNWRAVGLFNIYYYVEL